MLIIMVWVGSLVWPTGQFPHLFELAGGPHQNVSRLLDWCIFTGGLTSSCLTNQVKELRDVTN